MPHFTVTRTREIDHPADRVFAGWLDPALRARFETPEGAGMRHLSFATEPGQEGVVQVAPGGNEVGRMIDVIRILEPGVLAATQSRGVFGGATTMVMQNIFEVRPRPGGCTFTGTSQMFCLDHRPTRAEVENGWDYMLDRFVALLDEETR
jgi:uncharacterized protein YndB with AHSA1/START domain